MSRFRSSKSIVNWLNRGKVVMYSDHGYTFFYKMIKGNLYTYSRLYYKWIPCHYFNLHSFFFNMNNWYKTKHSEVY